MNLVPIYQGLADQNRLRIVHLLTKGPLGVKHLQELIGISQVRVSKHLAYLRERGIVEVQRHRNWMFYRLPLAPPLELKAQFECLRQCARGIPALQSDLSAREAMQTEVERAIQGPTGSSRSDRLKRAPAIETTPGPPESPQSPSGAGWGPYGESEYVD